MRSFASDNNSSVHPLVMEALIQANTNHAIAYGDDPWTTQATDLVRRLFTPDCEPLFVFNGTGSNTMALTLLTRPYEAIYCAETAHIFVDECGAPAKATGCQLIPIATPDGKLTPDLVKAKIRGVGEPHHSQPGAIYISQCTELGTVYTPQEVKALCDFAHSYGIRVHMDGARIANAAAALNCSLKEVSQDCGVDTLTLGGTKNGLMMGECVVVFNPDFREQAMYHRKQACQLASKMRYLTCQFIPYLTDDLYLTCARHANAMAQKLEKELLKVPSVRFTQKMESNQLFFTLPRPLIDALLKDYFFYFWDEPANEIRLVTSFDTTEEDIQTFMNTLNTLL